MKMVYAMCCFHPNPIVYGSDHGEMLGDHGQWQKLSPLQASAGVPLLLAGPGVTPALPDDAHLSG